MATDNCPAGIPQGISFFERYLTIWVALCIVAGIALGSIAPGLARSLDAMAISVDGAPVVSIPIALCLFFMMYPIMVKIDFAEVLQAGRAYKPVALTLFVNWAVKPFTMFFIASWFLGSLLLPLIGADAVDHVKLPLGTALEVGASYGAGTVVLLDGVKMLEVPLWRSYLAGCILLGVAPCTAMVLVWSYLARGNVGHTLIMVAINSLTMLFLYGVIGGFLLGVGKLPVPWEVLLLSIGVYVALPLVAGYLSRKWILAAKGEVWFREKFLHLLTPVTIGALLVTLVLLFSFKGDVILGNPLIILMYQMPRIRKLLQVVHGQAGNDPGVRDGVRPHTVSDAPALLWLAVLLISRPSERMVTTSAAGRIRVPRPESGGGEAAVVSEARRLSCFQTHSVRGSTPSSDAAAGRDANRKDYRNGRDDNGLDRRRCSFGLSSSVDMHAEAKRRKRWRSARVSLLSRWS